MAFSLRLNGDGKSAIVRRIHWKILPQLIIRDGYTILVFRFKPGLNEPFYTACFRPGQSVGICLKGRFKSVEEFKEAWKKL